MGNNYALVQDEQFLNYKNMPLENYLSFMNLRYSKTASSYQGNDKKKKNNKPIDTRGIIPFNEFKILEGLSETLIQMEDRLVSSFTKLDFIQS